MHREMRDISGDLKERANLLQGQIDIAQARFQTVITELKKERAIQRQRLETELQTVHRLINIVTMQHALRTALQSAVAALDKVAPAEMSKIELPNPTNPPTGANAAGGDPSSGAKETKLSPSRITSRK
jgi:hypothetical protein